MDGNCSSCLEGILENHTDIRGGCHFCLIKTDIGTYIDALNFANPNVENRQELIGKYITEKYGISYETFSAVYSFIIKQ